MAVIQSARNSSFATSVAATFTTANVESGNKIIAVVGSSWNDAPSTVRNGALNNWTLLGSKTSTTGSVWLYGLDVPAGDVGTKPTITVTFPSSNGQSVLIQEVSGLASGNTTAMLDGTPGGLSGSTAATGSPTYSSTATGSYLVCCYGAAGTLPSAISGWTLDANSTGGISGGGAVAIEYKDSTGGSETSGFTGAATGGWSLLTVAFPLNVFTATRTRTSLIAADVVTPARAVMVNGTRTAVQMASRW